MFTRKILTVLLAAGLGFTGAAAAVPLFGDARAADETALDTKNAALFLPESYEQYLDLSEPSCVAMSEHYLAVADGQTLYVYDREAKKFDSYSHGNDISTVQFDADERLYFSNDLMQLYEYTAG